VGCSPKKRNKGMPKRSRRRLALKLHYWEKVGDAVSNVLAQLCHRDTGAMASGVASYGALGHMPPQLPTISFLVHFRVNLTANYPSIV